MQKVTNAEFLRSQSNSYIMKPFGASASSAASARRPCFTPYTQNRREGRMSLRQKANFRNAGKNYLQLFFSSFCFIFLPLMAACVTFFLVYYSSVQEKALDIQQKNLESGVAHVNFQLSEIRKINQLLAENQTISALHASGQTPSIAERRDFLRLIDLYCGTNDLISNIYLHYSGDRWLYSRSNLTLLTFFARDEKALNASYVYLTLNGQNYLDAVTGAKMETFLAADKHTLPDTNASVVLYSAPVYKRGGDVALLSVVEMRMEDIVASLQSAAYVSDGSGVMIYDDAGNRLFCTAALNGLSDDAVRGQRKCSLNGVSYCIQTQAMDQTDWQIVLLTDMALLPSAFGRGMLLLMLALALALVLDIVLMSVFINKHYAPLHDIYQIAKSYYHYLSDTGKITASPRSEVSNEFQLIHGVMDELYCRVQRYSENEKNYAAMLQKEFWMDVLNQKLSGEEEYARRAREMDIPLQKSGWCVLLLEDATGLAAEHELFDSILENLRSSAEYYLLPFSPLRQLVCVLAFPEHAAVSMRDVERACQVAVSESSLPLVLGAGRMARTLEQIGYSCFEAHSALDFCHLTGRRVTLFEDIDHSFIAIQKPVQELLGEITRAVAQENLLALDEAMNKLKKLFLQYNWPLYNSRHICFEMYNVVLDALNRQSKATRTLRNGNLLSMIMNIQFQDDVIDFTDELLSLTTQALCQKQKYDMADILRDIERQRRFANPGFSFSLTAQEIGLSNSSFTRAFQKYTGKLPMDYLVELRTNYAKELLAETDQSVVEIAEAVGYYSVSSFSKRFKSTTGLTPKEYRQRFGKNSADNG